MKFAQFQYFCRYLSEATDVYYSKMFFCPFIFSISISLAIFAQIVLKYPAGIGAAICCYVQLLLLCNMGSNLKEAVRLQFILNKCRSSDANEFPSFIFVVEQQHYKGIFWGFMVPIASIISKTNTLCHPQHTAYCRFYDGTIEWCWSWNDRWRKQSIRT